MKTALIITLLVTLLFTDIILAGIASSPGLQRKFPGNNCTLQWTVTGAVTDVVVYNQTSGISVPSNSRVSLKRNSNIIILTIINSTLWDAGNYTLSVFDGAVWENDSSALLFVFASGSISGSQTLGRIPPVEGDAVEWTCTYTSNSLPMTYRPRVLYGWSLTRFTNPLQVLSNGSLQTPNGDIVSGYSTRNGGKILTIASVQYADIQNIGCSGKEEGSTFITSWSVNFNIQYKPIVLSTNPPSGKFNAIVRETVQLSIYNIRAYPALITTGNNWTFVDSRGNVLDIPDGSVVGSYSSPSLSFTLTSSDYYGRYSYNVSNAIGTTVVTFDVLPPGPPDAPTAFQVACFTHFSILLQWNCMWSNFNSRNQYVYTQLREPGSNVIIINSSTAVSGTCYNSTYTTLFDKKIQPETNYEAVIWSANDNGSSSVQTIGVRSGKVFRFVVSSDSIQLNGATAIVNYRIESGNITRFYISFCYELTGVCSNTVYYYVNSSIGQVSFSTGSLPNGTDYVFDFFLYVGNVYYTPVGTLKGVRVSRVPQPSDPGVERGDGHPAVIALAVVLGIAVLAIIVMLIGFICWRRRHYNIATSNPQANRSVKYQLEAEDHYERPTNTKTDDDHEYANLDHARGT